MVQHMELHSLLSASGSSLSASGDEYSTSGEGPSASGDREMPCRRDPKKVHFSAYKRKINVQAVASHFRKPLI